ncbi:hypothetical protein BDZ89DRAFT_1146751 [Hymenopellis radicata]|nr:hypothetical protein BDZ89DRAFT_1146751 [Hymenopellis radicata]
MVHARKGGRPRKYFSDEERLAAHRVSNRASWQRRAEQQNLSRRENYRKQRPTREPSNSILKESDRKDLARTSLLKAQQVEVEFTTFVGIDPRSFVEARLLDYLSQVSSDKENRDALDTIDGPAETIGQLRQKCYDIRDHLWQRVGSGKHYDRITDIMDEMRRVEGWLMDVSCEALISSQSLREMYSQRQLQYQK